MQKRSLTINGHRTSIALEAEFWQALETIAVREQLSLPQLVAWVDDERPAAQGLASALRVFVLKGFTVQQP